MKERKRGREQLQQRNLEDRQSNSRTLPETPHMDSLARNRSTKAENSKMEESGGQTSEEPATKFQADEIHPLLGKPYFHVVLVKSHLNQMVLPTKMHPSVPSAVIPAVLVHQEKRWEMTFNGDHRTHKRFDIGWRTFVNDNNLKAGDACVFELMECNTSNIKFRVQILRGDIPSMLLDRANGETSDTAIVIE